MNLTFLKKWFPKLFGLKLNALEDNIVWYIRFNDGCRPEHIRQWYSDTNTCLIQAGLRLLKVRGMVETKCAVEGLKVYYKYHLTPKGVEAYEIHKGKDVYNAN